MLGAIASMGMGLMTLGVASPRDVPRDLARAGENLVGDFVHVHTAPARWSTERWLVFGGVVAVGVGIYAADREIHDALLRNEHEDAYRPIRETGEFLEPVGFQGFVNKYLLGAWLLGYLTEIEPLERVPADILESFILSAGLKEATNRLVGRRVPADGLGPRAFGHAKGRSFPSGHSVAIVTVSTVVAHHVRSTPVRIAAHALAGTVLLQRVTSERHWPSDVYTGAVLGYAVTRALLDRKSERRLELRPVGTRHGLGIEAGFRW